MEKIVEYDTVEPKRTQYDMTSEKLRDILGFEKDVFIESVQVDGENNESIHIFTRG